MDHLSEIWPAVTFIVDGSEIRIMNLAVYALKRLQAQMQREAEKAGITSDEDIARWITASRREDNVL